MPGLDEDIAKFKTLIESSDLSESFKSRAKDSAQGYTSPSKSLPGLADEIDKFNNLIDSLALSDSFKRRIKGSAQGYTSASAQDRLYSFITKYGLDTGIHDVWKKARNPVAHGTLIDLISGDVAKMVEQRNKILYLCHAIVLAYVGYTGHHTRYDLLGFPMREWNPSV